MRAKVERGVLIKETGNRLSALEMSQHDLVSKAAIPCFICKQYWEALEIIAPFQSIFLSSLAGLTQLPPQSRLVPAN
ncbi:MAG: hypothetical protein ABIL11_02070 [Chloroflexota bacterium]